MRINATAVSDDELKSKYDRLMEKNTKKIDNFNDQLIHRPLVPK